MGTNSNHQPDPDCRREARLDMGKWILTGLGLVWIVRRALRFRHLGSAQTAAIKANRPSSSSQSWRGHEATDANAKWIFACVLGLAVLILAIHFILAAWLSSLKTSPPPTDRWRPVQQARPAPAEFPRLQVSPPLDLENFRAREDNELNTYGWIDKRTGLVRIPIERAMDVVLSEGLPVRTGTNQGQPGPSSVQLIKQRTERRQPEVEEQR